MNLTQKIKSELEEWERRPRTPQKSEQLKKLGELLLPADGFRVVWRNHVAHAREKYEDAEARKALRTVADYLRALSDAL